MAKQHHATDDEWAVIERANQRPMPQVSWSTASCILELRDRIQQLEAAHPPSPAADKILALQDQVRDGALTLAEALKKIGAAGPATDPFCRPSLADTLADTHHCSFFNTPTLIRAFKDWLTQEGEAPLAMCELLEAQAQIAERDLHA